MSKEVGDYEIVESDFRDGGENLLVWTRPEKDAELLKKWGYHDGFDVYHFKRSARVTDREAMLDLFQKRKVVVIHHADGTLSARRLDEIALGEALCGGFAWMAPVVGSSIRREL